MGLYTFEQGQLLNRGKRDEIFFGEHASCNPLSSSDVGCRVAFISDHRV